MTVQPLHKTFLFYGFTPLTGIAHTEWTLNRLAFHSEMCCTLFALGRDAFVFISFQTLFGLPEVHVSFVSVPNICVSAPVSSTAMSFVAVCKLSLSTWLKW